MLPTVAVKVSEPGDGDTTGTGVSEKFAVHQGRLSEADAMAVLAGGDTKRQSDVRRRSGATVAGRSPGVLWFNLLRRFYHS